MSPLLRAALPVVLLGSGACGDRGDDTLTVAAASSLRELLETAVPAFLAEHPGVDVELAFDASSAHARQIAAGAGFDVFLSADEETLARVGDRLVPGSVAPFLANALSLVARADLVAPAGTGALTELEGPVAVGGPEVPSGRYARDWLARRGLLTRVEPRFVLARSARATVSLVAAGSADLGLVYATDARARDAGDRVRELWSAAPGEEPRVLYHAAIVSRGVEAPLAAAFLAWLRSEGFQGAAREAGFLPPPR